MSSRATAIALAALVVAAWSAAAPSPAASGTAAGRGEGGIVLGDGLPVFAGARGDRQISVLAQHDAVAALASLSAADFHFMESHGRVQVLFFAGQPAKERYGCVESGQLDLPAIDDAGTPMTWRKLRFILRGHVLGEASLTGLRGR
ncbi:MAG TPA: hypothetical protein VGV61_10510 [Thermoanaerobaculia bacterium]|jgi:hypothetical protein|nr:hypothetical protein [Thermoanaerobaculia bacterium]